jgi:uncharacterized protein
MLERQAIDLGLGFIEPLVGGALIGISASIMWTALGRVAGISGIVSSVLHPEDGERTTRIMFLGGLVAGGLVFAMLSPGLFADARAASPLVALAAGTYVGFGARLAGGCTSGHGVCGISRLSPRSIVATIRFISSGAATVLAVRTFGGVQ